MSRKKIPLIGKLVRTVRKARKPRLTTTELGRRIGLSNVAITRGEKEQRNFSEQTLYDLAHELGTDFGEPLIRAHLDEWLPRMMQIWDLEPRRGNGGDYDSLDSGDPPPEPFVLGPDLPAGNINEPIAADLKENLQEKPKRKRKRQSERTVDRINFFSIITPYVAVATLSQTPGKI